MDALMNILIVDDDHINTTVLKTLLGKDGHNIATAANGEVGVQLFASHTFDLVLLDIIMPRLNGYEAAREIKRISADRFVPIIFLTAITEDEGLARCIDAGGDDFLTKPFNRVILKAKIDAMARIRHLHKVLREQKMELERHQAALEQELEVGQHLFEKIVRAGNLLDAPGLRHWSASMSRFNGDLMVATETPTGALHVMLGDFAGHGLSAAVGALPLSEIFYGLTAQGFSIGDMVEEMNAKLSLVMPTRMFCAACLLNVDPRQQTVSVWNGGLPELLVVDGQGRLVRRLASNHLPLGIMRLTREDRKVEIVEMQPGYRIFLYSDGLIEAINPEREMFGSERLEALFQGQHPPDDLFPTILSTLDTFRQGARQSDDISLLEIQCGLTSGEHGGEGGRPPVETVPPSHWEMTMDLSAGTLKSVDPLPVVINALMKIQAPAGHRERIHTVLSELYSNALDHGLLELDSRIKAEPDGFVRYYTQREERLSNLQAGYIRIHLSHVPIASGGRLLIQVEDSGLGFDPARTQSSLEGNLGHGGRGLALVRSLCEEVSFDDRGKRVRATYRWNGFTP